MIDEYIEYERRKKELENLSQDEYLVAIKKIVEELEL